MEILQVFGRVKSCPIKIKYLDEISKSKLETQF